MAKDDPIWKTGITTVKPNHIVTRGYRQEDLIGNVPFSHNVFLILSGRMPTENEGKMMDEGQAIKIYNHVTVDSDFNIHLFHDSENVETSGSSLGLYLASFLKKHGLVNHSIWIQET